MELYGSVKQAVFLGPLKRILSWPLPGTLLIFILFSNYKVISCCWSKSFEPEHFRVSRSVLGLADYLRTARISAPLLIDRWPNIHTDLYFLSGGKIEPSALFSIDDTGNYDQLLQKYVHYLRTHGSATLVTYTFPGYQHPLDRYTMLSYKIFQEALRQAACEIELEREFRDTLGRTIYRVYRIVTSAHQDKR